MADINKNNHHQHPSQLKWQAVTLEIRQLIEARGVHPSQVVVLVPYAQLIGELRTAWMEDAPAGIRFTPQFQSTLNWAQSVGCSASTPDDVLMDPALDALTARVWLGRAGLGAHATMLVPKLMDAAWSLVPLAASKSPSDRLIWSAQVTAQLVQQAASEALAFENAVAQLALTWVAHSAFATDSLFAVNPPLLVVLEGFNPDPLVRELASRFGDRSCRIALQEAHSIPVVPEALNLRLHAGQDAQDEAQIAAACVVQHLVSGTVPVALVAIDRLLTRRVQALLEGQGIVIRDETGWKLSTTRAAARVRGLLQACVLKVDTDDVMDWLKNAPAFQGPAVRLLEAWLRRHGMNSWPNFVDGAASPVGMPPAAQALMLAVNQWRLQLAKGRPLKDWLAALREALVDSGEWSVLSSDDAGLVVLKHLLLDRDPLANLGWASLDLYLPAHDFSNWVSQALEAAQYVPAHPENAQVIVLPLSQLLGRSIPAIVLAGCDEVRLPMSPLPAGPWSHAQRMVLGLALRQELAESQRAAWNYAIRLPNVDLVWRVSESGETLLPSGFVQELQLHPRIAEGGLAPDPRAVRTLSAEPGGMASAQADGLVLARLSHSAYDDLRKCPYRYFALRHLGLAAADELDGAVDKRDFGTWLHRVLFLFHESLKASNMASGASDLQAAPEAWMTQIDQAAAQAMNELGLSEVEFLPFSASWPNVRNGYLSWLALPENQSYANGESWQEIQLGPVKLVGKLDRIDRRPDQTLRLLDYKTEALAATKARVKEDSEDTQLPFYAALMDQMAVEAEYVNVGEHSTESVIQPNLLGLREQLAQGILDDMQRIGQGHALIAMGQGKACDYCDARGLCRKDMAWEAPVPC